MARLNILLTAVLVLCALALVNAQHRSRSLFIDLETARARTAQLETRWSELQVEQRQFARNSLIDAKARSELAMRAVAPERMLLLTMRADGPQLAEVSGTPARGAAKASVPAAASAGSIRSASALGTRGFPAASAGAAVVRGTR